MAKYKLIGQFTSMITPTIPETYPIQQEFEADTDEDSLIKGKELWDTVKVDFPTARFIEVVKTIGYIQF